MNRVVVSLGSNIDRRKNIRFALEQLDSRFADLEFSTVFETRPVGFEGPDFYNLVAGFGTGHEFTDVWAELKEIERQAGREIQEKSYGSRVLDIDILLFGHHVFRPDYNVPRDEIEKFAYVLKPLSQLYPDMQHPVTGQRFDQMWASFDGEDQCVTVVDIDFSPDRSIDRGAGLG